MTRDEFRLVHPEVHLIDVEDREGLTRYLRERAWLTPDERITSTTKPGDGNMNYTLRVETTRRSVIVKQARPWVEKYDQIPAPWDRALVEARFYDGIAGSEAVQRRMPRLLGVDRQARVLLLEDLGHSRDLTSLYQSDTLSAAELDELIAYLVALHRLVVPADAAGVFANRDMRALNHEYIFRLPLAAGGPVDLNAITPGLEDASAIVREDDDYRRIVAALGDRYLADGPTLLHGDYFPGSWLRTGGGVAVIDPEFCFLGDAAFDVGVCVAHLLMARQPGWLIDRLIDQYSRAAGWDDETLQRALRFAGVEIMRRLIGVAQLPLVADLDAKRAWLARSRRLVRDPGVDALH